MSRSRRTIRKDPTVRLDLDLHPEDWKGSGPRPKSGTVYLPHEWDAGEVDEHRRTRCSRCGELWEHRTHAPSHAGPRSVPPAG